MAKLKLPKMPQLGMVISVLNTDWLRRTHRDLSSQADFIRENFT